MNIAIVSYSMTGNNDALAASISRVMRAEHIRITEPENFRHIFHDCYISSKSFFKRK